MLPYLAWCISIIWFLSGAAGYELRDLGTLLDEVRNKVASLSNIGHRLSYFRTSISVCHRPCMRLPDGSRRSCIDTEPRLETDRARITWPATSVYMRNPTRALISISGRE
ncbi:hypothetical protein DFH27DRAFT_33580 [Peziza echinospora]|nr:hypothetical protein DFH27DRAFT_33580 [Peziza echinospora]